MMSAIDRAANALFPAEGSRVANVKFMLGGRRDITAVDLADQFVRADSQVRGGGIQATTNIDGDLTA
ncbi:MAG: hypothetical protein EON91_12055 [Brevundimonas sp.]|uniref:hypothetical protein n=1 Tax=Brevundimonas sp. TaxID=1871086 RepID=UPI0012251CD5|nr:hypothetical protein [Brevundimonas sp.]RZJ16711.1 MAG: hypothetical protein EON91_12055 [Brevundimonas sp.]